MGAYKKVEGDGGYTYRTLFWNISSQMFYFNKHWNRYQNVNETLLLNFPLQ